MEPNIPPKFQKEPLSEEKKKYILISFSECENLTEREINCPYCGHALDGVFSDISWTSPCEVSSMQGKYGFKCCIFRRQNGYRKYKRYILQRHGK